MDLDLDLDVHFVWFLFFFSSCWAAAARVGGG